MSFERVLISPKSCIPYPLSFQVDMTNTHLSFPNICSPSFPLKTVHVHSRKNHYIRPPAPSFNFRSKTLLSSCPNPRASNVTVSEVEEEAEVQEKTQQRDASVAEVEEKAKVEEKAEDEVTNGYTMTQLCDKMIEVFMNEKPKTKDWKKILVFRDEWKKYREHFYYRCEVRAETDNDSLLKQKLIKLGRKIKMIDEEMERHDDLLKEIHQHPLDINAIVARRREDFTGDFFKYLQLLSDSYDSLEDRDAMARLGAKCLSAVSAYNHTLENVETLDAAQAKFDDILNSPSLDVACDKIKALAKAKELDSSLILLINKAWASAKESTTMKNEVKEIMYQLYKITKNSLRSMAPQEIKLLKYLLNIVDPEERFSALATAFSPGDECEAKDANFIYTTPKELHKWIKIMLDAYHLSKEDTDLREARDMSHPMVIQRLFVLKEIIETEYMKPPTESAICGLGAKEVEGDEEEESIL